MTIILWCLAAILLSYFAIIFEPFPPRHINYVICVIALCPFALFNFCCCVVLHIVKLVMVRFI